MELKQHYNYVVEFADGACKVGVTARPNRRIKELQRAHRCRAIRCAFTPATDRKTAFELERLLCCLTAFSVTPGKREWHIVRPDNFHYLRQTTGMFWHLVAKAPYESKVTEL